MLTRTVVRAACVGASPVAGPSSLSAVRHISMLPREVASIASGKRPTFAPPRFINLRPSIRHFSWRTLSPGGPPTGAVSPPPPSIPEVSTASPPSPLEQASTSSSPDIHTSPEISPPSIETLVPLSDPAEAVTNPALLPHNTLGEMITNSGLPLEEVLASPEAVHAAVSVSDLKLMGLSHAFYSIPGWGADMVVSLHNLTGLPWFATIALAALCIRVILFPFVRRNFVNNAGLRALEPQTKPILAKMKEAKTQEEKLIVYQRLAALHRENKVSQFLPMMNAFFQMPFWISMFYGLTRLADAPLPGFREGGFGWFTDLTVTDSTWILPLTSAALLNVILKVGADGSGHPSADDRMRHITNGIQMLSPIVVFFLHNYPVGVLYYWISTNCITCFQALMLRQNAVKRLLRLPITPKPVETSSILRIDAPWTPLYMRPFAAVQRKFASYMDTLRFLKEYFAETQKQAVAKQKRDRASLADKERRTGERSGTALMMTERTTDGKSLSPIASSGSPGRTAASPRTVAASGVTPDRAHRLRKR